MKIHRKVCHTEENHDEDSYNSVCNNESSLYTGFFIRREFVRGSAKSKGPDIFLLYRIFVIKLVIAGFHIIRIPL